MRDPVLAGVLSLIIPGVGQLYNGRILAGILWLIFTPGFWIGTGGTLGGFVTWLQPMAHIHTRKNTRSGNRNGPKRR